MDDRPMTKIQNKILVTKSNHNSWPKVYFYFDFLSGWNSTYFGKKWRYLWRCSKSSLLKGEKWLPLLILFNKLTSLQIDLLIYNLI